ncbi:MAG: polysaccharide biosynthesis tyrosine autokinase [Planctomycetota bacterium]|nr:polysaccharide biosynthesis tyrosine autokinase [Planctomycetota bacterium]
MNNGYGEVVQQEEETIRLGEIFSILYRNKRLIVAVTTLVAAVTLFWICNLSPKYSAQATLLLEQDEAAGGVLSELASLTSDPQAEAEIALLKSRSLAAVTSSAPFLWRPEDVVFSPTAPDFDPFAKTGPVQASLGGMGTAGDPSAMENLGLLWEVDRFDLRPFEGMMARVAGTSVSNHRLHARLDPIEGDFEGAPIYFDVSFSEEKLGGGHTISISPHDGYLGANDDGAETFNYTPRMSVEAFGFRMQFLATGDYSGQRYRLKRVSAESAVSGLMQKVTAAEMGRKTNVILVTVQDTDPNRAAETANALCKNYIRRSVRIGQQKASQTVKFIDAQLVEQLKSLQQVEAEVVRLHTENPETIAVSTSATALIEQAAALELQITQADLAKRVIEEAIAYLDQGDYEALARLGQEMPNLIALGYIRELATLEIESLRLDRSDVLGYKMLLTTERQRVKGLVEESQFRIDDLESSLNGLRAGNLASIARVSAGSEFQGYLQEISKLDAELSRAKGSATAESPLVRSLESARGELLSRLTEQVASALDGAKAAKSNYSDLRDAYAKSLLEWPEEERETINVGVQRLQKRLRLNLKAQIDGISTTIRIMKEQAGALEGRLGALPEGELALAKPMREREARTKIVEFLLTSQQQATITAASTSASAVLIDPAFPPKGRIFPRVSLFLVIGTLLGFLLGCGLALVHNLMRGALHSEAEVERVAGVPVLGSVPNYLVGRTKIKGAKKGIRFLPMRDKPESPQAEAYRQIRASLRMALEGAGSLKTLACTSCVPGEGKTVTNADLALVFAGAGDKVLLVDCDLRKPQVHNIFDVERGPGFGDVLEGRNDWRDCVSNSASGGVDVLPAGRCNGRPGELLAGDAGLPIIDELTEAYDLVVFDLPPAVVVADVSNFASKLDALILIYRSGGVSGRLLGDAAGRLRRAGVNLMGVIVNAVIVQAAPGGYGYGYGYTDHYGEEES